MKNVHGKIGRGSERGRETEKVRETREEDIDKTRKRSDAETFY